MYIEVFRQVDLTVVFVIAFLPPLPPSPPRHEGLLQHIVSVTLYCHFLVLNVQWFFFREIDRAISLFVNLRTSLIYTDNS